MAFNKSYSLALALSTALVSMIVPSCLYGQTTYERGIAVELFTGQRCTGCHGAASYIKEALTGYEDNPRVVWLSHHAGYYPDSLTVKESYDLCSFLGVSAAPTLVYNRSLQAFASTRKQLFQSVSDFRNYNAMFADYDAAGRTFVASQLEERADISLDMDVAYDELTRHLTVRVYGEKNADFAATAPAVSVYLVQDSYIGMQAMGGGLDMSYEHVNAVRQMLSSHYLGDFIQFEGDGTYSIQYDYDVPETFQPYDPYGYIVDASVPCDTEKMHVVAIVANRDEQSVNNPNYNQDNVEIFNAVKCKLGNNSSSSLVEGPSSASVTPYVEAGRIVVDCEYDNLVVYDISGMMVDNYGLTSGIYIVKVCIGDDTFTSKVMVP